MSSVFATDMAVQELAVRLVRNASVFGRVMFRRAREPRLSRTEANLLVNLEEGPQRITALAELAGLTQPTITALVNRLEARGWVARRTDPEDGRVVLVSLTVQGRAELQGLRERIYALLHDHLTTLSASQLAALEDAATALADLVSGLQEGTS
jgi:DNA-binding MarR family transcriptional regulator